MNDVGVLAIVTGLALISVVLTSILFKYLDSQAEGKGKLLGGTIRYGGSLAGFVLLFTLLYGAFYQLRGDRRETTPVSLAGTWSIDEQTSKHATGKGTATIQQRVNDPVVEMGGEITGSGATTFNTLHGVIVDRAVYFIYENADGERGLMRGQLTGNAPNRLRLMYTDLAGFDRNGDPSGIFC